MNAEQLRTLYADYAKAHGQDRPHYVILLEIFRQAWCRETAAPEAARDWTQDRPQAGQDDVTALVVFDLCGGRLLSAHNGFGTRYVNSFHQDGVVDVAADPGPADGCAWRTSHPYDLIAERAAKDPLIHERYHLLRRAVIGVLNRAARRAA